MAGCPMSTRARYGERMLTQEDLDTLRRVSELVDLDHDDRESAPITYGELKRLLTLIPPGTFLMADAILPLY
jgi:hypothetical protein